MINNFQDFANSLSTEQFGQWSVNAADGANQAFKSYENLIPQKSKESAYNINMFMQILQAYHEWLQKQL